MFVLHWRDEQSSCAQFRIRAFSRSQVIEIVFTMTRSTKRIVLTGVTRGLGRAMLQEFVACEYTVAGCGRSEAAIEKLRLTFRAPHRFVTVDVADNMQVGQ